VETAEVGRILFREPGFLKTGNITAG